MQFTRVQTAVPGAAITSGQMRSLARSLNDRLLSGIGDGAPRLAMYHYNLFRQVRNPDATGLVFPANGEFFESYQLLDHDLGYQWPVTGPGEFEGGNLANPMMQFVHGVGTSLHSEEGRLNEGNGNGVPLWGAGPPQTAREFWDLAKAQRGAIDAATYVQAVPALEAAQSFFQIVQPKNSSHGKSWGGFFPAPVQLLSDCGASQETGLGIPSYAIKFTSLAAGQSTVGLHGTITTTGGGLKVCTYAGSCPAWSTSTGIGHVLAMARLPFAIYVAVAGAGGAVYIDRFDRTQWIEGPYTGSSVLEMPDGGQLQRSVWNFATEFKGTPAQRTPDDFRIESIAFDFQAFAETQYFLSPCRGLQVGPGVQAIYPFAKLAGALSYPANTFLPFNDTIATSHAIGGEFCLAGYLIEATRLAGPVTLEILDGSTIIRVVTLTPDGGGSADDLHYFAAAYGQQPANLRVRLASACNFLTLSGNIRVEFAPLFRYKPNFWDFYLLLRMGATQGGDLNSQTIDGVGTEYADAPGIWQDYLTYGCIVNRIAAGVRMTPEWITDNPVYDSMRRLSREQMRIVSRRQFRSYQVAGGKSILRFYRHIRNIPGFPSGVDAFTGIAPLIDPVPSGELIEGETYIVRGGMTDSISYNTQTFPVGFTFVATSISTYIQTPGALVYAREGIRTAARKKGWSNRWVMFLQTKVYHPSFSSLWKTDAYADYFAWNNRCMFYGANVTNKELRKHISFNHRVDVDTGTGQRSLLPLAVQSDLYVAESPSSLTYALGSNHSGGAQFYKSCQVYPAPYEIESAVIELLGSTEIVKITLKTRLDAHESAPATVGTNPLTWSAGDKAALAVGGAEDYRTDDNAIREYALREVDPTKQCYWKVGDAGTASSVQTLTDNPFGSCYPHFFFTKLIPEPYEDGNDTQEPTDTRATTEAMLHAEFVIRSMAEGFIDGQTSQTITCQTGACNAGTESLYDYRFENLCFEAFGGTNIGAFPLAVRIDRAPGHGPLPNTKMYAEVFNRLGSCANLLTRARVHLPFIIEARSRSFTGKKSVRPDWPASPASCHPTNAYVILWSGSPPAADTLFADWSAWNTVASLGVDSSASIDIGACPVDGGPDYWMISSRSEQQYRINLSADAINAIPAAWRGQISELGGFIGRRTELRTTTAAQTTTTFASSDGCCFPAQQPCPGLWWDGTSGYHFEEATVLSTDVCLALSPAGHLDAGLPPAGAFAAAHSAGGAQCYTASSNLVQICLYTQPTFYVQIPLV